MKRPAFQFYPDNWRNSSNLRRCSWAARGVWIEVICLMHDSERYGCLPWTLKEIAQALGCPIALLRELVEKGVLKGADTGDVEPFSYTPRSGRREGAPVVLIERQPAPLWFSSRMVRDEHIRGVRGDGTRFGEGPDGSPNLAPKGGRKPSPKGGFGEAPKAAPKPPKSDGPSSSTPTSYRDTSPLPSGVAPSQADPRGSRLDPKWLPDPEGVALCRELGLDVARTLAGFGDHWRSQPGAKGRKADWDAVWRNWCRREVELRPVPRGQPAVRDDAHSRRASHVAAMARDAGYDPDPILSPAGTA